MVVRIMLGDTVLSLISIDHFDVFGSGLSWCFGKKNIKTVQNTYNHTHFFNSLFLAEIFFANSDLQILLR